MNDGERAAFNEFVQARLPKLLRFGHALTGDPHSGADLVQDALERAMLAWSRIDAKDDPEGYVRRIMVNRNVSIWRRHRKERLTDQPPEKASGESPGNERDDGLWEAIKQLPAKQRAVIVLRYYEDLSEVQIAATMGVSTGTVKSQASRAMAKLRTLMDEKNLVGGEVR
ncbi:SigE family RNA polymerase sigma factor [Kribbella sp. NBC_01245]|uniref:SigE family RNA polymerase sigma factor n=1 Tax=Kribbella sp. NBC_01245 TaxID=2903578 RepID=UPI002E29A3B2|nr:SigE family RNA polymerase sigma factor [Kribbella sp. NBC_01245]